MNNLHLVKNNNSSDTCLSFDIYVDDIVVGECQLRSVPTKSNIMPEGFESHSYCEIKEEYRCKGYATMVLDLVLEEARKLNLDRIHLSVAEKNIPSIRVIEKNGGVQIKTGTSSTDELYRLYEIVL